MATARQIPFVLRAAHAYLQRGWAPIPVPGAQKEPILTGWQNLRLAERDLPQHFGADDNVGLLVGEPSGGLCDTDLDAPEAVTAAPYFLPDTGRIHGRAGKPVSHYWYMSGGELKTTKFQYVASDKKTKTMLVEVRWTGCQTLVPPSRHPSGEQYIWHRRDDPAVVGADVLLRQAARTAACALLARMWPGVGSRDDAALALAGLLLRAGWDEEETDHFVTTVAIVAGDEEARKRAKAAGTARKLAAGEEVTGGPRLADLLIEGENVVNHVCRWLGVGKVHASAYSDDAWDTPLPLPDGMPAVDPFDMDLMPAPLRGWVHDIAERMQVPVDFLAVGAIVEAGALIGRRIGIYPKKHDDWLVVPNLWGAIVAPPSQLKSPALAEVLKPLDRLAADAMTAYQEDCATYDANAMVAEAKRDALQRLMKSAAKDGNDAELERLATLVHEIGQRKPVPRRFKTNDGTVEKIAEILLENPPGILIYRDELSGWLRTLDKQGHEGDRAFYLEAWNGTGNFNVDRIGRGSLHVPALCLSVLGGIQPGPLSSYVYGATTADSTDNDGLLQRFQLLVWPDAPATWKNVDRWPNTEARVRAFDVLTRLASLTPEICGATRLDDGPDAIPAVRFSAPAQEVFDVWRDDLERRLRSGQLPEALAAHLAKYRSLMPSLALIFHLMAVVDVSTGSPMDAVDEPGVSLEAVQTAAAWCEYLESHAQRLYASAVNRTMESARALAARIASGDVVDGTVERDVYRKQWSRLSTPEEVDSAVKMLEAYGWLRVETGARKSTTIRINPQVRQQKPGKA